MPFPAYQSICELHGCYHLVSSQLSALLWCFPLAYVLAIEVLLYLPITLMGPCTCLFTASTPFIERVHVVSGLSPAHPLLSQSLPLYGVHKGWAFVPPEWVSGMHASADVENLCKFGTCIRNSWEPNLSSLCAHVSGLNR